MPNLGCHPASNVIIACASPSSHMVHDKHGAMLRQAISGLTNRRGIVDYLNFYGPYWHLDASAGTLHFSLAIQKQEEKQKLRVTRGIKARSSRGDE